MIEPSSSSDDILRALSRADDLLEQGCSPVEVCRRLRVSSATYQRWRRAHSRTFLATAHKLEALEEVHARLLEVLTEQQQEILRLRRLLGQSASGASDPRAD